MNNVVEVKPGATILLNGLPNRGSDQVVLAWQRYGRGKALALPVQDTWMWRMHVKMDVKDETHFTFWRRLARWLVDGVPDRVMVASRPEQLQKGEPLTITADVFDAEFKGVNDGRVTAHVTAPSGKVTDVPMEWTVEQEGEYAARFTPSEDGVHKIVVDGGSKNSKDLTRGTAYFLVAPSEAEFFDAAMHAPVLRRIADDTGGRFFRANDTLEARRRHHLQRQGHHGRGRERAVGHADQPVPRPRLHGRRVVVPAKEGTRVMKRLTFGLALASVVGLLLVDTLFAQRMGGSYDLGSYTGNVRYDGKFVFVRMSYSSMGRGKQAVGARLPVGRAPVHDDHDRLDEHRRARQREQHHVVRRPGDVQVPGHLPLRAGLLAAERAGRAHAAQLPAQGRLPHRRRLPRANSGATSSSR